jgi:hypothetical protein
MKTYLHRQKNIGYHKEAYENLIKYAHRLININNAKPLDLDKLKREIEAEKVLGEKKWLLAQIEIILQKR